jgi:hypothetical protein
MNDTIWHQWNWYFPDPSFFYNTDTQCGVHSDYLLYFDEITNDRNHCLDCINLCIQGIENISDRLTTYQALGLSTYKTYLFNRELEEFLDNSIISDII